jgi:2,4-dienoyl-CoA reductase-like NADH-dependent reductase (Old Yellow Enzyme family)
MTPWRCSSRSFAETAFIDLYGGRIENAIQILRLLARAIKQRMKYDNPEFSRIAWDQFIYKLQIPRKERIARWLAEGKKRAALQQGMEIPNHDR